MATTVTPTVPAKPTGKFTLIEYGSDEFGPVYAILDPQAQLMYKHGEIEVVIPETNPVQTRILPAVVRTVRKRNGEDLVAQFNREVLEGRRLADGSVAPPSAVEFVMVRKDKLDGLGIKEG